MKKKNLITWVLVVALLFSSVVPASAAESIYFPKCNSHFTSIVDALKSINENSSFEFRREIAQANGFENYSGKASENNALLAKMKAGCLIRPGAQEPANHSGRYYPKCDSHHNSIVTALESIHVDASFSNRKRIAAVNGFGSTYSGRAEENIALLNKLKAGMLVDPTAPANQNSQNTDSVIQSVSGASTRDITYIEVTSISAPLRKGPGKSYDKVATLQPGDCLVYTGFTENKYGNIWYICEYSGNEEKLYLFSEHAIFHDHSYEEVSDEISLCTCGEYTVDRNSELVKTGVVATAGTFLGPEVVAAVKELAWAAKTFGSGATAAAANPVTAVAVVAGALIYMGVSSSGSQVKYLAKISSAHDAVNMLEWEEDSNECYYASCFLTGATPMLLLTSEGMDLDDATDYLEDIVYSPLNAFKTTNGHSLLNIWTFWVFDAEKLCINFASRNNNYAYGTSKQTNCDFEHDKYMYPHKIYFQHYHVHTINKLFSMEKVDDVHILFGVPIENNSKA